MEMIKVTSLNEEEKGFLENHGLRNVIAFARDYETLRDCIIDEFNPADEDMSEDYIMCKAITGAALFILGLPCTCPPDVDETYERCGRCATVGRRGDKRCD